MLHFNEKKAELCHREPPSLDRDASVQLRNMHLNLNEFIKKCSYSQLEPFSELKPILTKKNQLPLLNEFLQRIQTRLKTDKPNSKIHHWHTFTSFFANFFGKSGAYHHQIAYYQALLECEKILNFHLKNIATLSVSVTEGKTSLTEEFQSSRSETKTSIEICDEKSVLLESKTPPTHKPYYISLPSIPTPTENINNPRASYAMKSGNSIKHYSNTSDDKTGAEGAYADMINSMLQAQHIIFIAGWLFEPQFHFSHKISQPRTLGEILIDRAIAKPKLEIAILIWRQFLPSTHHSKAYSYLKQLAIARGLKDLPSNLQLRQVRRTGVSWSHHQKFLVVDIATANCKLTRELAAFYGSADFAGGKFDWHEHPILDTDANKNKVTELFRDTEIYRPATVFFDRNTPRLPWRETLSQVKGPVTMDFITEFVDRWLSTHQGALSSCSGSKDSTQRVLNRFIEMRDKQLFTYPIAPSQTKKSEPLWDAQVVRTAESCLYASQWLLKKNYEKSIHKAYLQAINQAEKFIYIETQYITAANPALSKNRVPQAIVNRIIEQHQAGKPFHVFIVLPMLPNGDAGGKVYVEPVRYLQWKTMRYMMDEIEAKTGVFWGNYLSFYFFGQWLNRHQDYLAKFNHPKTTRPEIVTYSGHAAIYLHSKLMIVDDNVVINGSANLTERSLAGPYDSEIAVYQKPSAAHEDACINETRQFRRNIWEKYFGLDCLNSLAEQGFIHPERIENITVIRKQALKNLTHFMSGKQAADPQSGYLLAWPFKLKKGCSGEMETGCDFLPDTLLKDIRNKTGIFKWFPPGESKPTALKIAEVIKHKGYN